MNCIDKNIQFQVGAYLYRNFTLIDDSEVELVWRWRNNDRIRSVMTNCEPIPFENHLFFISELNEKHDRYYWLVYKDELPVAVFSIVEVDFSSGKCIPGYYLSPELLDSGEGLFFHYNYKQFLFEQLGFEQLSGTILFGNTNAFLLSSYFFAKPTGVIVENERMYLEVSVKKSDFVKLDINRIVKDFISFTKRNSVNWVNLKEQFQNEYK